MPATRISNLANTIKEATVAAGFQDVQIEAAQAEKLAQANVQVGVWVAADDDEAAVVRIGANDDVTSVHVQFPLTAALPANLSATILVKFLALATFLPESGLAIDASERLCWNFYREFPAAQAAQAQAYVREVLKMRRRLRPELFAELRKLGLTTSLARETDLRTAAARPLKLTPQELAELTQGGFFRSLVVGLALGAGSVVIAGATGGVGTVVGVIGEAAYGAALS
jgi:hypothetical protein